MTHFWHSGSTHSLDPQAPHYLGYHCPGCGALCCTDCMSVEDFIAVMYSRCPQLLLPFPDGLVLPPLAPIRRPPARLAHLFPRPRSEVSSPRHAHPTASVQEH